MSLQTHTAAAPDSAATLNPFALLAETEASEYLGIAVQTLRNWRWKGEGPRATKVGKRCVRYRQSDLDAFLDASTAGKAAA